MSGRTEESGMSWKLDRLYERAEQAEAERDVLREAALQVRVYSQQGVYPDPYGSQGPAIVVGANAYFDLVSALGEVSQTEARAALERRP